MGSGTSCCDLRHSHGIGSIRSTRTAIILEIPATTRPQSGRVVLAMLARQRHKAVRTTIFFRTLSTGPTFKDAAVFLLAHPGGPYFVNKNEGVWTIPQGTIPRVAF